jgi:sigma-B regulation protein RsbU (phosphoserine phosphatase)
MTAEAQTSRPPDASRILIVDDDEGNLALLEVILDCGDYRLDLARDGNEALEAIARSRPDLMLLDGIMPGLDGFEVCRRVKAAPAWRDIVIVMISGLDESEGRDRAMQCGADDFVAKPVGIRDLKARVQEYLKRRTHAPMP